MYRIVHIELHVSLKPVERSTHEKPSSPITILLWTRFTSFVAIPRAFSFSSAALKGSAASLSLLKIIMFSVVASVEVTIVTLIPREHAAIMESKKTRFAPVFAGQPWRDYRDVFPVFSNV